MVRARGQQKPTTERYSQIQQALIEAGHLQGEASGKWDETSVTALKSFQEAHSLEPTGKINAISLIALGLGPKRGPAPGTESVLTAEPAAPPAEVNR